MYEASHLHLEKKIQAVIIPNTQNSLIIVSSAIVDGRHGAFDLHDLNLYLATPLPPRPQADDDGCSIVASCTTMGQPLFLVGGWY